MPLDSTTPHTTALAIDLDVPSLPALAYALRHREAWPAGFVWDYNRCSKCAMGLIHELWNNGEAASLGATASIVKLPYYVAFNVFLTANEAWSCSMSDVTPEMVADLIDAHLASAAA